MKLKQKLIGIITAVVFTVNACMGGLISFIAEASWEGVSVGNKTVEYGTTSVVLPLSLVGVSSSIGCIFTLNCDYTLEILSVSGRGVTADIQGTSAGVCVSKYDGLETDFASVKIVIADGAEPGTYPVNITVSQLDDNGDYAVNPVGYSGSVTIASTEPELPGDISGNGKIDLYDAIEICKSIMGMRTFTDEEKAIADYDGNGKVDLYDAIGIAKKLLEK